MSDRTPNDARRAARSTTTYEQADWLQRHGYMPEGEWAWYVFFWTWSSARFTGRAGTVQDYAFNKLGPERFYRRRARVRALRAKLAEQPLTNT